MEGKVQAKGALFKAMRLAQGAISKAPTAEDADDGAASSDSDETTGTRGTFAMSVRRGSGGTGAALSFSPAVTRNKKRSKALLLAVFDAVTLVQYVCVCVPRSE